MASTVKIRLCRHNGTDYDTIHLETEESMITNNTSMRYLGVLNASNDLNTIRGTGYYAAVTGALPTNKPSDAQNLNAIIISYDCLDTSINEIYQRYICFSSGVCYEWRRRKFSTSWGSWYRTYDSAVTISVANGGTGATTAANARTNLGAVNIVSGSSQPSGQNTGDYWLQTL